MNGKPVYQVPAKTVINFTSAFRHKLLCDGLTFSTGSACVYSCAFCYVPDLMRKSPHMSGITQPHQNVVIRRRGAIAALRAQLLDAKGRRRFADPSDRRVIFSSPLVDVAGNLDLVAETIEACQTILELTNWDIRFLSKSNLLPRIAAAIPDAHAGRMIYGVSTGTLDDRLSAAFEGGTPLVSRRIQSLHQLQDQGLRTFGMICPSLPKADGRYADFADEMKNTIRADRCEHVWAEVINVRGESMSRTVEKLRLAGYHDHADSLYRAASDKAYWESYARATFLAHVQAGYRPNQLRYLQYVTKESRSWWEPRQTEGAIML